MSREKDKDKKDKEKEQQEGSARTRVIKDVLEHFTHDLSIGKMVQTGELRKRIPEPPFITPAGYNMTRIDRDHYSMNVLTRAANPSRNGIILQLHGGGYIGEVRNKYYTFAKMYCEMTEGFSVVTPDYRVGPEHKHPCALSDALDAYQWIMSLGFSSDKIILAGDSAGGGLCMALAMYLRDHNFPMPKAIIAMSPWTDVTASGESYKSNFDKDILFGNTYDSMIFHNPYFEGRAKADPYASPLFGNFEGMPQMLIQVGSDEMLLSDSTAVAAKAKAAGVPVKLTVYEGMFHVFQMCYNMIPESKEAWDEIEEYLRSICNIPVSGS